MDEMFDISKQEVIKEIDSEQMLVAHMDDTILKKTGKKIPGTAWRRDPLGPPFQTNFIWGQRFIQISLALPSHKGLSQSKAIPVDFHHCPTAKKPGKKATELEKQNYKELQKQLNLSIKGVERIPTPEEIRQADNIEWKEVKGWVAGKEHTFNVKVVKDLRWENAGGNHNLQLVIIRPLRYRLTKKSRLLYRNPAYLICTDTNLDVEKLMQAYLWRWKIEVNFRDEKTLFGSGKAQVRNEHSVENVPAIIAVIYSYLLIAAHKTYKKLDRKKILPRPKWYPPKNDQRLSTREIINLLRSQLWVKALGCDSFPAFVKKEFETRSRKNYANPLSSAIFYVRK